MLDLVKCDIAIISEHKLKCDNVSYLDSVHPDYLSYVCIEPTGTNTSIQYSRYLGKGGIAIMYRKELELSICWLTDLDSTRIIGIELKTSCDRSLFIFGVYLPSDSAIQPYASELNLLEHLEAHYSLLGDVVIGGDFNASSYEEDLQHTNL